MAEQSADRFAAFLDHSLRLLAREAPRSFAAVRDRLRGVAAAIELDRQTPVRVQLDAEPWVARSEAGEVRAEVDGTDLARLLRGELTIEAAVRDERLHLRGSLEHLLGFLDGLESWIHGAVRCPSFPALYREFLSGDRP